MPNRSRLRRKGFTLPEVLVTVAIISLLAAVVIPTVAGQLTKGDTGRVGSDLMAIRGGTEQFLSDVRRYPSSISQLTTKISTGMTPLTTSNNYTTNDVARWHGPYLNKDQSAALSTGYGLSFTGSFALEYWNPSGATASGSTSDQQYLVVKLTSVNPADAQAIDNAIDDGVATTGSIRFTNSGSTGSTTSTLAFLAVPIQ